VLQLKIGIRLAGLRLPLKRALPKVAELGGNALEVDGRSEIRPQDLSQTARRQIKKMLDDYGLGICAVGFRTRRGYNVRGDLERRIDATKRAMTMAYELGARVVVNQVGQIPAKAEGADWELLVETLSDLGHHGQRCGAVLAAQTGAESGEDLARLIGALPEGAIGVAFDPAALIVNGFSPHDSLAALGRSVVYVLATDAVPDLAKGRGVETLLGEGIADYAALLGMLEQNDYRGSLTVDGADRQNPELEIRHAIQFLRKLT
jgi:sugar phosphate isomerase/epimerase